MPDRPLVVWGSCMKSITFRLLALGGALASAGAATAFDLSPDPHAFQKVALNPDISLVAGHDLASAGLVRSNALRALSLGDMSGIASLVGHPLLVSEREDDELLALSREGLAEFKVRVIDALIASLPDHGELADDFAMPLQATIDDPLSVAQDILASDPSTWGNDIPSADTVDASNDIAGASDTADTSVLADIAGGGGPVGFDAARTGGAFTGGHLADISVGSNSGRHSMFAGVSGDFGIGTQTAPGRSTRPHAVAQTPAKPAVAGAAVPVPLPRGAYGALATLLSLLTAGAYARRRSAPQPNLI